MNQPGLFGDWISADQVMPEAGLEILRYYESEEGEVVGPVVGKAVYVDGKYFYRKLVWWMPVPPLPVN